MGYLKDKTVYLAGPIHAVEDDGIGWRDEITPKLQKYNIIVDDPCKKTSNGIGEVKDDKKMFTDLLEKRKFKEVKEKFYPIVRKDLRAVDKADFLIVVYDPTIHMCGTLAEIINGHSQKKPMLMFVDPKKITKINPWILTYFKVSWIYDNWEKMFKYIKKIDSGKFDTSYWTL